MRKIFVIGGAGFLGTSLIKKLDKNFNVDVFCGDVKKSNTSKKNVLIDVEKPETLDQMFDADTIVNLAAVHRDDIKPTSKYDDVNVQGAKNICNAARKHNINKIIFTSSVAVYGFAPPNTDENGELNYFNHYGRTKYLAEKVYKSWQAEDKENRSLIIIRPTVIFGEGNRGNVYNLLSQIFSKKFIMFGNGKNKKSMAYVQNVAAFIEYCIESKKKLQIYNYIDKPDYDMNTLVCEARKIFFGKNNVGLRLPGFLGISIGHLADLVAKVTFTKLPVSSIRVKKFMGITQFSSSVSETGFVPPISLEEGLARTIRYEFLEDNSDKQTFDTE